MRAIVFPPALEKSRQPEEVEAFDCIRGVGRFRKYFVHLAEKRSEPAQIHLVVANDAGQRLGGAAPPGGGKKTRGLRGKNNNLPVAAHPRRVEGAVVQIHETRRTKAGPSRTPRREQEK